MALRAEEVEARGGGPVCPRGAPGDELDARLGSLVQEKQPGAIAAGAQLDPDGPGFVPQAEDHFPIGLDLQLGTHLSAGIDQLDGAGAKHGGIPIPACDRRPAQDQHQHDPQERKVDDSRPEDRPIESVHKNRLLLPEGSGEAEQAVRNFFLFSIDSLTTLCYFILVVSNTEYKSYRIAKEGGITLKNLTEMLKGVLEGCVLEIISYEEIYGYEITRRLNALGFSDVVDGTVYTILIRLEKNELVDIEKKPSDMGPPRKFYALNDAGREELRRFWEKWEFVASKIDELKENHR